MVLHMPGGFRRSVSACRCKMSTPVPAVLLNLHQGHLMPCLHLALLVTAVRHLQPITCAQSTNCAVNTSLTSSHIHLCRSYRPSWPTTNPARYQLWCLAIGHKKVCSLPDLSDSPRPVLSSALRRQLTTACKDDTRLGLHALLAGVGTWRCEVVSQ
jgi:hypothetical protein